MRGYKRRNRTDEIEAVKTAEDEASELVLRLTRDELLDKTILLPHAEVNPLVYDAMNRFVEKYAGRSMELVIMTGDVSEAIRDIFEESYRSHYEDEYRKIVHYLHRRYVRAGFLLLASVLSFWIGGVLTKLPQMPEYLVGIFSQVSVFCLWEIGYTHFTRTDAAAERDRITRARDASIRFHCRGSQDDRS